MNHKRRRPKNRRAGCLLCKPNKMNGWGKDRLDVQKVGFHNLKGKYFQKHDLSKHE